MNSGEQGRLTRALPSKAMLFVGQDVVFFKVVMNRSGYYMLKDFAGDTGEGDGWIIGGSRFVILLVNWNYVCFEPVRWEDTGVNGFLENCGQSWGYGGGHFFQ